MKWYSARIVTECKVKAKSASHEEPLFDESVVIIRARNDEDAYKKALSRGKKQNVQYYNSKHEKVVWRFCGLADLDELLEPLRSGAEISSRLVWGVKKSDVVVPKRKLTVFWAKHKGNKKASELIDE